MYSGKTLGEIQSRIMPHHKTPFHPWTLHFTIVWPVLSMAFSILHVHNNSNYTLTIISMEYSTLAEYIHNLGNFCGANRMILAICEIKYFTCAAPAQCYYA